MTVEVQKSSEIPKETTSIMKEVLDCAYDEMNKPQREVQKKPRNFGYYFVIDDIIDGTIPIGGGNGDLSDSLRYELINKLSKMVFNGHGNVLSNFPVIFRQNPSEIAGSPEKKISFGLNQFGEVDPEEYLKLSERLTPLNNAKRAKYIADGEKIIPYKKMKPIIVKGAFTRNDENPIRKVEGSFGASADGFANASLNADGSHQIKSVTLSLFIENPQFNLVEHSASWTLNTHEKGYSIKLDAGYGDASVNASFDNLSVDSKQGAQQTLIDMAALWLVQNTYGDIADIDSCMKKIPKDSDDVKK
jgi:hypothetical protein